MAYRTLAELPPAMVGSKAGYSIFGYSVFQNVSNIQVWMTDLDMAGFWFAGGSGLKPREGTLTGNAGIPTMRRAADKRGRRYARVMYPYLAQEGNELCLEVDDVIEVLEGDSGGWCLGYLGGDVGLFPSNYVKFLSSNEGRPHVCTCSRHREKLTVEDDVSPALMSCGSVDESFGWFKHTEEKRKLCGYQKKTREKK
ncbi:hypothetical protein Bbelb_435650 [Branchiostoma belcheri]|nr:hypothetical protein Bbelb_435650 [Branchiostoma belcheri]